MSPKNNRLATDGVNPPPKRYVLFIALGLILPGIFQLKFGPTFFGRIAIAVWIFFTTVVMAASVAIIIDSRLLFVLATNNSALLAGIVAVATLALFFIVAAFLTAKVVLKTEQTSSRRVMYGVAVFVVVISQLAVSLWAGSAINSQRELLNSVFVQTPSSSPQNTPSTSEEPAQNPNNLELVNGRVNVLLLGGDAGSGRWGLRPDSISVVSVDAQTGESVIVGVPRNLEQAPFRAGSPLYGPFPNGYDCGSSCLISYLYTYGSGRPDLYSAAEYAGKDPGIEATKDAVEGVLGIDIPYVILIDMAGFANLVNAVGGVTVCVPVDTLAQDRKTTFLAGCQKMTGDQALLYSRTRYDSNDYGRMQKQRLVQQALLEQINPLQLALNFQSVAQTGSNYVSTNIPRDQLPSFIELALKAQKEPVQTLELVPPTIDVTNPDIAWIQSEVLRLTSQ